MEMYTPHLNVAQSQIVPLFTLFVGMDFLLIRGTFYQLLLVFLIPLQIDIKINIPHDESCIKFICIYITLFQPFSLNELLHLQIFMATLDC